MIDRLRPWLRQQPTWMSRVARCVWRNAEGFSLFLATLVGFVPCHVCRRFFYRIFFGVKIGEGTIIHWQTRFFTPSGISIGKQSNIGNNAFLDGRCGIQIGNRVATGSEVMIYTLQHDVDRPDFAVIGGRVVIGDYVYIGPRAIVLPGVSIGEGAVVGAGAVVTRDVAPYTVVGGVPARPLRERPRGLNYRPDFATPFQ